MTLPYIPMFQNRSGCSDYLTIKTAFRAYHITDFKMCTALALHPKQLKTVKPGLVEFFEICNEYVFVSNTMYTIKNARRVEILRMFVPCFHT